MAKNKNNKGLVVFVAIATTISLAGLTGLFGAGSITPQNNTADNSGEPTPQQIEEFTGIPCLTNEEFHLHPKLTILIDGAEEQVPPNIGVFSNCVQELHTHESDGTIHVESDRDKGYTFQDFLNVWGLPLEQEEFITRLTVDGEFNDNDTNFKLADGQQIQLEFISIPAFGDNAAE